MRRSASVVLMIAAIAATAAAPISAQGQRGGGRAMPAPAGPRGRGDMGSQVGPRMGPPPGAFARTLFAPELVMRHQTELDLTDAQRTALIAAMTQAQTKAVDARWKIAAERQKLEQMLQAPSVDESQALAEVDRVLSLEHDLQLAQMTLMIRVKNTLTPAQQQKLRQLRGPRGFGGGRGAPGPRGAPAPGGPRAPQP